jgi:hypothetical protein
MARELFPIILSDEAGDLRPQAGRVTHGDQCAA